MHPNKRNFAEGMELILKKWTALQLAIDMEWGGHTTAEKALDLEDSLLDYFEKGTLRCFRHECMIVQRARIWSPKTSRTFCTK